MSAMPWLCALALGLTALTFPALRIYFINYLQYNVSAAHAILWALAAGTAAAALLAALAALLPRAWRGGYAALLLGFAFFAWLKGAFFGWDYGMLTGDEIDWTGHAQTTALDLSVLFACAAGALLLRARVLEQQAKLAGFLVAVQLVSLATLTPFARPGDRAAILAKRSAQIVPRASEKLSEAGNVIIVLLDTLQSDVLAAWLAGDASRREALRGFTFFRDTVSAAGVTWLSVPNLLTGTLYDNQAPYGAYLDAAYDAPGSVLKNLRAAGYYVELDPWGASTPVPVKASLLSNVDERWIWPGLEPLKSMLMLGSFTVLPQIGQAALYPALVAGSLQFRDARTDSNLRFIRDIDQLPVERVREPVLKFIHLRGPHVPVLEYGRHGYDYLAAARDPDAPAATVGRFTRANYARASAQMLAAVLQYLEKLRAAGMYDRSTIIVLGDHGGGRFGQRYIALPGAPYDGVPDLITSGLQASAAAALLAKPSGADGPLVTSDAPVQLSDIAATVNLIAGRRAPEAARPLFDPPAAATPRERRFIEVAQIRFDAAGRLPPLTEYRVGAPMWRDASWRRTGRRFSADGVHERDPVYTPGAALTFGDGGSVLPYLSYGWRVPLPHVGHLWTDGRVAQLALPLAAPMAQGAVLELEAASYDKARRTKLSVNGVPVASLMVDRRQQFSIPLAAGIVKDKVLALRFDLPDAISPEDAFGRPDDGLLSLQVFGLRVRAAGAR